MAKISGKTLGEELKLKKAAQAERVENMGWAVEKIINKEMTLLKAANVYEISKSA